MKALPFDYAVRNLGRSTTRLIALVLGSTMVVLLIVAAAGFVQGMEASFKRSGDPRNVILLGAGSEESVERSEIPASVPGVLAATVPGIVRRAGVDAISPEVHVMLPVKIGTDDRKRQIVVRGVTPTAMTVHEGVRLTEGRLPVQGADEIIAGSMAYEVLGVSPDDLAIGKSISIDGRSLSVVGSFNASGTVFDSELWTPMTDIQNATKRETISCVVATLDPAEAELADIDAFTKLRPDLELSVVGEADYYGSLAAFFKPLQIVTWITALLIATGGVFGGLNTLYAAFAARIREFGTLRSLGYRKGAIVLSLIQESVIVTMAGSLIACIAAMLFLDGVSVRFSMGAFGIIIDSGVILVGLSTGLALGIIGALPPAWRALNLSIPEALKAV